MQLTIFILYYLFFSFLITRIAFFNNAGINKPGLIALFSIKILAGIAYAKFYSLPRYYPGSDTWRFYRLSLPETKWLLHDPLAFLKDLFIYGYNRPGNVFSGENTYWNDLKSNVPVKMMAVTNAFTHYSYYTNIIFFNFLFLVGLIALFRVFNQLFPDKKNMIIAGIFLLPSALFWCSGIHKDGLILSAIGIIIYCVFTTINGGLSIKKTAAILISMALIFALRNYVLFALFPAISTWWLCTRYPNKKLQILTGVYITGIVLFFITPFIFPSINFPMFITEKRNEFYLLEAGSEIKTLPLQPSFTGFISFLPYALDMAFLRPHITEIKNPSYIPAVAETLLLILLIIVSLISIDKKQKMKPGLLFMFAFGISIMLVCGYTIPFTGAVVRYRSIALPLIITPLLCISNFSKFIKKSNPTKQR